ncbi:MAG: vitamin K epoxide reductase family protein [Methanobacterium sp.]
MNISIKNVSDYLVSQNIYVSKSYLKSIVEDHPYGMSIIGLTDTLDFLGISNAAFKITRSDLNDVPFPYLAWIANTKMEEFLLIKSERDLSGELFKKDWTGIVVAIENETSEKIEIAPKEFAIKDNLAMYRPLFFAILLVILYSYLHAQNIYLSSIIFIILVVLGIGITILIMKHELGLHDSFSDQICTSFKNADCDKVLNYKKSRYLQYISFGDLALSYFFLQAILISNNLLKIEILFPYLSSISFIIIPFLIISIIYQKFVIKKWCPLCLITIAILFSQSIFFMCTFQHISYIFSVNRTIEIFIIFLLTLVFVYAFKKLIFNNQKYRRQNKTLLKFKFSDNTITKIFQGQRFINFKPHSKEFFFGKVNAPIQLVAYLSPFCKPCVTAFEQLNALAINNSNEISITVRFSLLENEIESSTGKFISHIFQYWSQKSRHEKDPLLIEMLRQWYNVGDLDSFKKNFEINGEHVSITNFINEIISSSRIADINRTPTFFLNGYEVPPDYSAEDLRYVLNTVLIKTN